MANSSIPQASPSPPTTTSSLLTSDNARVQKFAMDGSFVAAVGSKGNGKGSFNEPENIVVHPSGQVLVADRTITVSKSSTTTCPSVIPLDHMDLNQDSSDTHTTCPLTMRGWCTLLTVIMLVCRSSPSRESWLPKLMEK